MSGQATIDHRVLCDAADWFALLRSGEAAPEDNQRWQHWLNQHPDHLRGWQLVERIEQQFSAATGDHPQHTEATLQRVRQSRQQRRHVLKGLGALAVTLGLGWTSWRHTPLPQLAASWQAQCRTGTGEIRQWTLADGTRLWLNTDSAVNTVMDGPQRQIQLLHGEILIETGNDPRPMVVFTAGGELRPLGTRFSVRHGKAQTLLSVFEGAVEITTLGQQRAVVQRLQQAHFSRNAIAPISSIRNTQQAWHKKRFIAEDIRLSDLIEELGRYQHGHIQVSPRVVNLRVFGGFPLDRPEQAWSMLENALPIRIHQPLPWWTSIEPLPATP